MQNAECSANAKEETETGKDTESKKKEEILGICDETQLCSPRRHYHHSATSSISGLWEICRTVEAQTPNGNGNGKPQNPNQKVNGKKRTKKDANRQNPSLICKPASPIRFERHGPLSAID